MMKTETINAGAWSKKFDAELNTDVCDRYTNAEITVILKLFLEQGNPASGARTGTANDSNGDAKSILRWSSGAWKSWKSRFVQVGMRSGHGRFWLINNKKWNKIEQGGIDYYPNIWCRLKIQLVNTEAAAHHKITVFRVTRASRDFRSNFSRMDSYDTRRQKKKTDSDGKAIRQRPAVHELFHALGVRHVDHGKTHCPIAESGNAGDCYGVDDADMHSLMGSGMKLQAKFADPWRHAAVALTGTGSVGTAADWQPKLKRHYPRTLEEVTAGASIVRRVKRK